MGNNIPKSVICKCLNLLNVGDYRCLFADYRTRKLTTGKAIQIFVESQLSRRANYEEIAEHLRIAPELQDDRLTSISASQLSRKLKHLPTDVLQTIFLRNIARIQETTKHKHGIPGIGRLRIIDSTMLTLPPIAGRWACWSEEKNAVKIHTQLVVADNETVYPGKIVASTAAVSDHEVAAQLVVANDAIHVTDRGYIRYELYESWLRQQIWFVARLQARNKVTILKQRTLPEDSPITLDADVAIRWTDKQKQTHEIEARLIEFADEQKRTYRLLTNVQDRSAEEISEIYRHRWLIELFFKWIKQHLRLVKLYSAHPKAVMNQIYLALITYSLVLLIKLDMQTDLRLWQLLKLMRLYAHRSWEEFQQAVFRPPARTSKGRRKKGRRGRPRKHPLKLKSVKMVLD
jgi:hypothetical protein